MGDPAATPGQGSATGRAALQFSIVVPTRGDPDRLEPFVDAIAGQSLPRERWELIVAVDSTVLAPHVARHVASVGGLVAAVHHMRGPAAARNHGAAAAHGTWLAFTEDDCTPAPDWLERAARRLAERPDAEVLAGVTHKPGGRPVHRESGGAPLYLPTNLFVRRDVYIRAGGYREDYYDPATGVFFREDSDFGFTLERIGARVVVDPDVRVEHPDEHPRFLDPLRWARRHEMDALLAARHPRAFRERIEVHRLGPVTVRRPIVRLCLAFVVALVAAAVATLSGALVVGGTLALVAAVALAGVWAKWGFDPRRLVLVPLVPFVLVGALIQGQIRASRIMSSRRQGAANRRAEP